MRPCARPYSLHASLATCPHRSAKCARRLWPDGPSPWGASPPSDPQLGFVFIERQDRPLASRLAACSSLAPSTVEHSGSFLVRAKNQPFKTLLRARYIPHLGLAIALCGRSVAAYMGAHQRPANSTITVLPQCPLLVAIGTLANCAFALDSSAGSVHADGQHFSRSRAFTRQSPPNLLLPFSPAPLPFSVFHGESVFPQVSLQVDESFQNG